MTPLLLGHSGLISSHAEGRTSGRDIFDKVVGERKEVSGPARLEVTIHETKGGDGVTTKKNKAGAAGASVLVAKQGQFFFNHKKNGLSSLERVARVGLRTVQRGSQHERQEVEED